MPASSVMYRTFVIANPCAGAGVVKEEWSLVERLLRANLSELDYAFTQGPGHATLLAREALRAGWEMIVAIGGDGTLNEVVNGFYEVPDVDKAYTRDAEGWIIPQDTTPTPINPDAVIGLVPLGTGGDFRRTLGLMGGVTESIEHLRGRDTCPVDLGQIGFIDHSGKLASRYFVNIAAAGLSGLVDKHVNSTWKGLGGRTSFVWATLRAFSQWRNVEVQVRLDDTVEITTPMQNLVVANGAYFGAGMWIAPGARVDDGEFQVVLMGDLSVPESLKVLPQVFKGTHLSSRNISRQSARRVSARVTDSAREFLLDIDGEAPGGLPATWHLHPGALKFKF